jgi:hypothetical protein
MIRFLCINLFVCVLGSLGCSSAEKPIPVAAEPSNKSAGAEDADSKIEQELSKLPEEDRRLAKAQTVCLVTGEPLGSMGTPIKITVGDRSLFVCCEGCEKEVRASFDKYFAKAQSQSAATSEQPAR